MSFGTRSVVELESQDDFSSVRHQLSWQDRGRIALVLPWDMRFLSCELDFDLVRREAERWQLEVAIISADPERRQLARGCGFPAFASVEEAQKSAVWSSRPPEPVEPPSRHWWEGEVELLPRSIRPSAPWFNWVKLAIRVGIFLLTLLVLAGGAYAIIPSGVVTLVPAGREFTTIVPVSVDPEVELVDHVAHVVPARRVGVEVEGHIEVETTGIMDVAAGRATGVVLFTNLLAQDHVVPIGTVVRTSSTSYPIRFRTTADVAVPAGGQATVPIEALEYGAGNLAAFQINQVEGVAASAVRVINPEPTIGAEPRETRVVTQADYDRARKQLLRQLLDQAYVEMGDLLESPEFLLRQSLRVEAVPKEAYTRFVTEQADTVGLNMRLLVSGLAVDVDNAKAIAYTDLSRRLPPGYVLVDARFELGEVAEEDIGPGWFTFFVTARGYAAAALDTDAAVDLIRGQRIADARERLVKEFPLAEPPRVTVWPGQVKRLPLLPLRISVRVEPQGRAVGQASLTAR
jgi:hypothetical protein